ncbi:MAG: IS66 family transposase [Bacteroidia bacterium]|nr:IS66 family transposase [Bacteroidia bacterium]
MKIKYSELEDKNSNLASKNSYLEDKNTELAKLVAYYEECFRLNQHRQFGQSSEKSDADSRQILLVFDEAENEAQVKKPEQSVEEITYTRSRRSCTATEEEDFDSLPIEKVLYSIPEEERLCPECGGPMHIMGHDKRRELTIIPARVKIVEHEREVYSCRRCEHENIKVPVIKAPMPEAVIKGSAASAASIAHIMVQKYMNGVPLYRQEMSFLNDGFFLSRQTMANWLIRASSDWLEPLYEQIRQGLVKEEILHADETVVQVLKEPGRSPGRESFMWLYRTGRYTEMPAVLYEYQETRSSAHPRRFLENFKGYLNTDGYSGYKRLQEGIRLCGCWAHARRKFHEASLAAPPEEKINSASQKGLEFCDRLFALEREYEQLSPEERYRKRLEQSKPVSEAFFAWASSTCALPKSALGKALHYALAQRPYLETFYLDGRLEISNNRAERSIKPFVIGRKNWLFCCTPKGAKASSIIYSIIETAKENRLKPFEYLKYIFETMPNIPKENYHTLLPWSKDLQDSLRLEQNNINPAQ